MSAIQDIRRALARPVPTPLAEKLAYLCIYLRFGADSAEADIVSDYLECDTPDWRGALSAWRNLARARKAGAR